MSTLSYSNILCLSIHYTLTTSVHRTITGTWSDDFADDSPHPGWSYSDNTGTFTNDPITIGILTYHGPYPASSIGEMTDDTYTITQQFYCNELSDVIVTYSAYYCDTESTDWVKLTLDSTTYTAPDLATPAPSPDYNDAALVSETSCNTWETTGLLGPYIISNININTLFTVTFVSRVSQGAEAIALSQIDITCNPLNAPTTQVPTFTPTTLQPITNIPTTTIPTTYTPTTSVPTTNVPTNIPTTTVPTTNIPTTTTTVPTTSIPTTNIPTTNIPTTNAPSTDIQTTSQPMTSLPTNNINSATTWKTQATPVPQSQISITNVTGGDGDSGIISITSTLTTFIDPEKSVRTRNELETFLNQSRIFFLLMGFVIPLFLCATVCFICLIVKKRKKQRAKYKFHSDEHDLSKTNNTTNKVASIIMTSINSHTIPSLSSAENVENQCDINVSNVTMNTSNDTAGHNNTPPTGTNEDNDEVIAIERYDTFGGANININDQVYGHYGVGINVMRDEIIIGDDEENETNGVTVGNVNNLRPSFSMSSYNDNVMLTAEGF